MGSRKWLGLPWWMAALLLMPTLNDALGWLDLHSGQLQSLGVLIVLGGLSWAKIKGTPDFMKRFWAWLGSQAARVPLRIVKKSTLDDLRRERDELVKRLPPPTIYKANIVVTPEKKTPLTLRERVEKTLSEMEHAMGTWDDMSVRERSAGFFQAYYRDFLKLGEELRRAGHMPTFEVSRLLNSDPYDYEDPTRGDMDVIAKFLRGLKWREDES